MLLKRLLTALTEITEVPLCLRPSPFSRLQHGGQREEETTLDLVRMDLTG